MSTLTEFTVFPKLPSELRLKIWDLVIRSPRVVTIRCKKGQVDKTIRSSPRFAESFSSTTPPPSPLHVCRESRYEALSSYSQHFATRHVPNYTYISMTQDSIRCSDSILLHFGMPEMSYIERLLLDVADAGYFAHFNLGNIRKMERLRELYLYIPSAPVSTWDTEGRSVATIAKDFHLFTRIDPGWVCPRVHIMRQDTEVELQVIGGNALIPGWVSGEPNPLLD